MTRARLATALTVVLGMLLLSVPCLAEDDAAPKAIALIDDFEDGNLVGWAAPTGACSAVNTGLTGADGSSRSLRIDGACAHFAGPWFDLGSFQATGISFWVRSGSTNLTDTYVAFGDDNIASNIGVFVLAALNNGRFVLFSPGAEYELSAYVANQWYRVDLNLDWVGRNLDIFIDGVARQYNVPFISSTTNTLNRLHFYNFDNSIAWLDTIIMSSPPPTLEVFENGFESADTTAWSLTTPAPPTRLVLFDGGGISGPIGGRSGADVLCGQAALTTAGIPVSATTRAFLSFSAGDEIRDFPALYGVPTDRPVTGPNWNVIADDWADLLDGSIDQSLLDAGAQAVTNFWYSGSFSDGAVTPYTCSGWTDGSTLFDGRYGSTQQTSSLWIDTSEATCGLNAYHVLCLAWR
ncbi:MAG TPA: hypothetical protein VLT81_00420 [Chondromyces sp.]|nr:hypothetical protein [Chondromyces sp.]